MLTHKNFHKSIGIVNISYCKINLPCQAATGNSRTQYNLIECNRQIRTHSTSRKDSLLKREIADNLSYLNPIRMFSLVYNYTDR